MKVGVTKRSFIKKYAELLRMTREQVADLRLLDDNTVVIEYKGGYQKEVNISASSGTGIIKDVVGSI